MAVQRICAWCGTNLEGREPLSDPEVTKSICAGCAAQLAQYRNPVLVVSRSWARLYEELSELLKDREGIQVVLDRRDSTSASASDAGWSGPDRRRSADPLVLR